MESTLRFVSITFDTINTSSERQIFEKPWLQRSRSTAQSLRGLQKGGKLFIHEKHSNCLAISLSNTIRQHWRFWYRWIRTQVRSAISNSGLSRAISGSHPKIIRESTLSLICGWVAQHRMGAMSAVMALRSDVGIVSAKPCLSDSMQVAMMTSAPLMSGNHANTVPVAENEGNVSIRRRRMYRGQLSFKTWQPSVTPYVSYIGAFVTLLIGIIVPFIGGRSKANFRDPCWPRTYTVCDHRLSTEFVATDSPRLSPLKRLICWLRWICGLMKNSDIRNRFHLIEWTAVSDQLEPSHAVSRRKRLLRFRFTWDYLTCDDFGFYLYCLIVSLRHSTLLYIYILTLAFNGKIALINVWTWKYFFNVVNYWRCFLCHWLPTVSIMLLRVAAVACRACTGRSCWRGCIWMNTTTNHECLLTPMRDFEKSTVLLHWLGSILQIRTIVVIDH